MLVHFITSIVRLLILTQLTTQCSFIITSIVRLLTYTADNTKCSFIITSHCKTANLHSWQMLVHYHFHWKTANLHSWQHKCSFIITSIVRLLSYTADKHKCSFIITSIGRLLTYTELTTQMLVHYHFHCKTANLHSWQHKCSFIITSIVRLLTYTPDNTNARSLSLPL